MSGTATVLLVHGAWHGPWVWERAIPALDRLGLRSATAALPSCGSDSSSLGGLVEDAVAVAEAAGAIGGDVVVCGHSYGGMAISAAAFPSNVRRLVYLCAFMPVDGASLVSHFPALPPFVDMRADGAVGFRTEMAERFLYSDCAPEIVAAAIPRLVLHSVAAITTPVGRPAWRDLPSTYVVAAADALLPPDMQRLMAVNAGAVREIEAGHSPMLSAADALAAVLAEAAAMDRQAAA